MTYILFIYFSKYTYRIIKFIKSENHFCNHSKYMKKGL